MGRIKKYTGIIFISIITVILITVFSLIQANNAFDETIYNYYSIDKHIRLLTSEEYKGRQAGSKSNEMAMEYIVNYFQDIGVKSAGENGTYYQDFTTLAADIDTRPIFEIKSESGELLFDLDMYQDYSAITSMNGGPIDFTGEMVFVGNNLLRVDPEYIKGRIVVVTHNTLTHDKVNYVIQNGGSGILSNTDLFAYTYSKHQELEKELNVAGKTGESILVGYISSGIYRDVLEMADEVISDDTIKPLGVIKNTRLKVDMSFPIVETANVLGKIDGKLKNGRVLLITAGIDGSGVGTDISYFPGAISNTSGLAVMMEAARIVTAQDNLPYETIVFIGFNNQKRQLSGSEYYLENPVYPIEKTTIIHLEDIGYPTIEGLKIASDSINSSILKDKISNFAKDAGLKTTKTGPVYGVARRFADSRIAAATLGDIFFLQDRYTDVYESVDRESIRNASMVLLNYIKRDVFKDTRTDYLNAFNIVLIIAVILLFALNILVGRLNRINPNMKIGHRALEDIYYSTPVALIRKTLQIILPVFIAVFLLVFLANIDPDTNISMVNNQLKTNFSLYLTLKNSILYFKNIFKPGTNGSAASIIFKSASKSLLLMVSSLILSTVIGIGRGLLEGYRSKRRNLRSLGTLVVFSIPDVLIVLLGLLLYVMIAKNSGQVDVTILKKFILPLITLSILPTIYITRMTYITIQDEIKLDYIRNARAKGLSKKKIFTNEILPAISFKIIDAMPAIMTMLFSNMIIVEYLFNYLGILNYLIYFYNRQNVGGFVALAVTLGLIYILLTWGIQSIARFVNPLKRKVEK